MKTAHYHLPGLFEFHELYKVFLKIYSEHREYFYDWCDIGSVYGAPNDCLWGGGRIENGDADAKEILKMLKEYKISARLTFSNSLLEPQNLIDEKCNRLCRLFEEYSDPENGVIICSEILMDHIKANYPGLYFVSSTTKVITGFDRLVKELDREDFTYVVPDFRLNKKFDRLADLPQDKKDKVEFLCNECCDIGCTDRKECYESVSRRNLGEDLREFICRSPYGEEGYRFSKAMESPAFIGTDDIRKVYLPMGFTNFKIEGRGIGSALVFEMLLYYMVKPECRIKLRELVYLDNMLDLF